MKEIKAFGGQAKGGWEFEVWLFVGKPSGEIRIFEQGEFRASRIIGLDEVAICMAKRMDLLEPILEDILNEAQVLGPEATKH